VWLKAMTPPAAARWATTQGAPQGPGPTTCGPTSTAASPADFDALSLDADLRARLAGVARIDALALQAIHRAADGTAKLALRTDDGAIIESVLIPDVTGDGTGDLHRATLCVSSQVGCAMDCKFCYTGTMGLSRHLTAGEIVDQVLLAPGTLPAGARIDHVVYMGMGEPLHNFDAVLQSIMTICGDDGPGYSFKRVTVSTSGLVPQIDRLGEVAPVNLAISLNATTDEVRDRLMPVNKRYPLAELIASIRRYPLPTRRKLTFEYVLLGGVNDSDDDARRLADLVEGLPCKLNLIPFNPHPGSEFRRPTDTRVAAFKAALQARHLNTSIRTTRGDERMAACGQLGTAPSGEQRLPPRSLRPRSTGGSAHPSAAEPAPIGEPVSAATPSGARHAPAIGPPNPGGPWFRPSGPRHSSAARPSPRSPELHRRPSPPRISPQNHHRRVPSPLPLRYHPLPGRSPMFDSFKKLKLAGAFLGVADDAAVAPESLDISELFGRLSLKDLRAMTLPAESVLDQPGVRALFETLYMPPHEPMDKLHDLGEAPSASSTSATSATTSSRSRSSRAAPTTPTPPATCSSACALTHALLHVLTEYDASPLGELALQAYYIGQLGNMMSGIIVSSAILQITRDTPELLGHALEVTSEAFQRGKASRSFLGVAWKSCGPAQVPQLRELLELPARTSNIAHLRLEPPKQPPPSPAPAAAASSTPAPSPAATTASPPSAAAPAHPPSPTSPRVFSGFGSAPVTITSSATRTTPDRPAPAATPERPRTPKASPSSPPRQLHGPLGGSRPAAKVEAKPEPKVEAKPEPKVEPKPEPKPEPIRRPPLPPRPEPPRQATPAAQARDATTTASPPAAARAHLQGGRPGQTRRARALARRPRLLLAAR
jgi:23S rRNA (adenine2503-C2)-methyltransferase